MEIVLTQDVENLGSIGSVHRVKSGYARNYLFPKKMAVKATTANRQMADQIAAKEVAKLDRIKSGLTDIAIKLGKANVTSAVTVGEDDKVFGSVTVQIIADSLKEQGFEISRKDILLDEPLKALGQYDVKVKLGHGVIGTVPVWVVKE